MLLVIKGNASLNNLVGQTEGLHEDICHNFKAQLSQKSKTKKGSTVTAPQWDASNFICKIINLFIKTPMNWISDDTTQFLD